MSTLVVLRGAVAGALSISTLHAATAPTPVAPEKCYGVAKAGKNECQTVSSACAGTSKQDGQPDAWIYLANDRCLRIVGGSLTPKSRDE